MNRNEQIEQRLRAANAPEAPSSLRDRILSEIPEDLTSEEPVRPDAGARWWQLAAAMILMIGGAWLAMTWTRDTPVPLSAPERRAPSETTRNAEAPAVPSQPSASAVERPTADLDRMLGYSNIGPRPEQDLGRPPVTSRSDDQTRPREDFAESRGASVAEEITVTSAAAPQAQVRVEGGVEGGVVGGVIGGRIA